MSTNQNSPLLTTFSTARLPYVGVLLGTALVLLALVVDLVLSPPPLSVAAVLHVYGSNPVQWIILTSPLFLGGVFFLTGRVIAARDQRLALQTQRHVRQFELLETFINNFEDGKIENIHANDFTNPLIGRKLHALKLKLYHGKAEERIRNWESEGLAKFADILRTEQNLQVVSDAVIRFVVKYVNVNQGSVFILNALDEANPFLELQACYAYDRKKHLNATVAIGQGLVGQCYLEKETIILHDVPKDYIKITSGLGMATPSFVAIIPIKTENEVTGILEIASFQPLENHEVRFLERACEAFASVIKNVVTAENVARLLQESQQQTEELRSQEEEMRQNMEELQAMQEQMSHQLQENTRMRLDLEHREHVLSKTTILSESDLFGTITFVNSKFCEVSQYSQKELVGNPHNLLRHPDMPPQVFKEMWTTIKAGKTFRGIVKNRKKDGTHYWVDATIVPIIENGRIIKYIGARYHIEDETMAEGLFERQLMALGLIEYNDIRMVS